MAIHKQTENGLELVSGDGEQAEITKAIAPIFEQTGEIMPSCAKEVTIKTAILTKTEEM